MNAIADFKALEFSEPGEARDRLLAKAALHFSSPFLLHAALYKKQAAVDVYEPKILEPAVLPERKDPAHDPPLFEPLHASDYFASQGIKLSLAESGDDKLGVQLKTFTAWLRTMKKVHGDRLPEPGIAVETAIQSLAEKSNVEEPVVTEPMAEALVQQGKRAKAVELYRKLSLLNPDKSGYFAAKIDNLNGLS